MNKTAIYSTAIASTIAVLSILAFSSSQVEAEPPEKEIDVLNAILAEIQGLSLTAEPVCPAENVQHWTLISFQISQTVDHDTRPDLEPFSDFQPIPFRPNTFEVKILQDIDVDIFANQMVADRLTELGYFNGSTIGQPFDVSGFFNIDVEYSTICAEN